MRRILIVVAALALLTTACKIEINAEFVINADKSGQVVIEFGYDDEIAELAEAEGGSPTEMLGDFGIEDVPGATTTTERRGDMTFNIITVPVEDFTQAQGLGGDLGAGLTDDFQITFTEDRVTVRGATTLDDALGGEEDMAAFPPEMMAQFFEINIRATLPGKILDHNATSQDGNTLTWAIDLTSSAIDIFAESDPTASSGGSSMLIFILIGAAVLIAALLLWLKMRKGGGTTAAAAPAPFVADTPPPAPPPAE